MLGRAHLAAQHTSCSSSSSNHGKKTTEPSHDQSCHLEEYTLVLGVPGLCSGKCQVVVKKMMVILRYNGVFELNFQYCSLTFNGISLRSNLKIIPIFDPFLSVALWCFGPPFFLSETLQLHCPFCNPVSRRLMQHVYSRTSPSS